MASLQPTTTRFRENDTFRENGDWTSARSPCLRNAVFRTLYNRMYPDRPRLAPIDLSVSARSIYDVALEIVGGSPNPTSVISCINGQVIYPTIFETEVPMTDGFLQLCCFPGRILWEGNTYDRIQSRGDFRSIDDRDTLSPEDVIPLDNAIPRDLNLQMQCAKLQWGITVEDECLQVALHLHYPGCTITQTYDPWCIITAHAAIYITTDCTHELSDCYQPFLSILGRVVNLSLLPRAPGIQRWNVIPRDLHYRAWLYSANQIKETQLVLLRPCMSQAKRQFFT